jgi:hypothetical protein
MNEPNQQEEVKARGFWSNLLRWVLTAKLVRNDPRILLFLAIFAVAIMVFGGRTGLVGGSMLLYYLFTIIFPALFYESLCRRFGSNWGTFSAFAPLWLPVVILLLIRLWIH